MCLILFANDYHPNYQLIVAANRDEYYNRPTLQASFWDDNPNLLAGKDLEQGGTWLGITKTGRFAAVTNFRDPNRNYLHAPSRGSLGLDYLNKDISTHDYILNLKTKSDLYNGFNLLIGDMKNLFYYSNIEKTTYKIKSGIHGLSNNFLDVPWPKVKKGVKNLYKCITDPKINPSLLFELLADDEKPADNELPHTGVELEWEQILSPIYVKSNNYNYGTRCSTVLLVDKNNHVMLWERSFSNQHEYLKKEKEVFYKFDVLR